MSGGYKDNFIFLKIPLSHLKVDTVENALDNHPHEATLDQIGTS